MDANLFWFSDQQWAKIVPQLPVNQPGPKRKDDRRILSGITHVLKVGCRGPRLPEGIRSAQDRLQSLLPLERERRLAKDI